MWRRSHPQDLTQTPGSARLIVSERRKVRKMVKVLFLTWRIALVDSDTGAILSTYAFAEEAQARAEAAEWNA